MFAVITSGFVLGQIKSPSYLKILSTALDSALRYSGTRFIRFPEWAAAALPYRRTTPSLRGTRRELSFSGEKSCLNLARVQNKRLREESNDEPVCGQRIAPNYALTRFFAGYKSSAGSAIEGL